MCWRETRGARVNSQYSFVFKPSGLRDNLNKRSERQLCSLSVRWLTACSEGTIGRLEVAMTNKLFSFSESGYEFVWEVCCPVPDRLSGCTHVRLVRSMNVCPGHTVWLYTCEACLEHECQCPGHIVWLYTCEACPEHECQCPGHTVWLYICEAYPEHECQCPGHTVWLYTCCISRTTHWISTIVFMPEWSSLTNVGGRISICP